MDEKNADFYDRKGKRISYNKWGDYRQNLKYKIIKTDEYDNFRVSTVWTGVETHPSNEGDPLIFETMIFVTNNKEPELNDYLEEYSTEEAAIKGHLKACELINQKIEKQTEC